MRASAFSIIGQSDEKSFSYNFISYCLFLNLFFLTGNKVFYFVFSSLYFFIAYADDFVDASFIGIAYFISHLFQREINYYFFAIVSETLSQIQRIGYILFPNYAYCNIRHYIFCFTYLSISFQKVASYNISSAKSYRRHFLFTENRKKV